MPTMTQNPWREFGWRTTLVSVLVGWFLPVAALQAAVILAVFALWAWRSEEKSHAGLLLGAAASMAVSAGLHLVSAIPVYVEIS